MEENRTIKAERVGSLVGKESALYLDIPLGDYIIEFTPIEREDNTDMYKFGLTNKATGRVHVLYDYNLNNISIGDADLVIPQEVSVFKGLNMAEDIQVGKELTVTKVIAPPIGSREYPIAGYKDYLDSAVELDKAIVEKNWTLKRVIEAKIKVNGLSKEGATLYRRKFRVAANFLSNPA